MGHVQSENHDARPHGTENPYLGSRNALGHHGQVSNGGLVGVDV